METFILETQSFYTRDVPVDQRTSYFVGDLHF